MPQLTYLEAIRQGIWKKMERDPTVFLYRRRYRYLWRRVQSDDGLIDRFRPERVIDTPIADRPSSVLLSVLRSLACVRLPNFSSWISSGAPSNQICQYGSQVPLPLVSASTIGYSRAEWGKCSRGPFHSQNPEAWFVHTPGLKVVCPASAY